MITHNFVPARFAAEGLQWGRHNQFRQKRRMGPNRLEKFFLGIIPGKQL